MGKIILFTMACLIVYKAPAQVPVKLEPRHHNVFENDYVRILDVWIGPGDTTQYHVHATPSVFISYSDTKIGSQLAGGSPVAGAGFTGSVAYDSLAHTRTHRVWSEDTTWFHVMDVELLSRRPGTGGAEFKDAKLRLIFDKPQARGYRLELASGEYFHFPPSKSGCLLLSMGKATVRLIKNKQTENRIMLAGHYEWIEPGQVFEISNLGPPAVFTILQMK